MRNKFKILSIDGGGGLRRFPAYYLTLVEQELAKRSDGKTKIKDHFQLITGTSQVVLLLWLYHFRYSCEEIYELL
jgi:patatin-like phospholipase/acyl hydrolase